MVADDGGLCVGTQVVVAAVTEPATVAEAGMPAQPYGLADRQMGDVVYFTSGGLCDSRSRG
jgi:hypothetical protein